MYRVSALPADTAAMPRLYAALLRSDRTALMPQGLQEFKSKQTGTNGAEPSSEIQATSAAGSGSPSDGPAANGATSRRVDRQLLKQLVAALQDIAGSDPPPPRGTTPGQRWPRACLLMLWPQSCNACRTPCSDLHGPAWLLEGAEAKQAGLTQVGHHSEAGGQFNEHTSQDTAAGTSGMAKSFTCG